MAMHVLLIYDISEDKTRGKIVRAIEDYGLERVQYSAFCGELSRLHQRELMARIRHMMRRKAGIVTLYPIDQKAWKAQIEVRND